MKKLIDQENLLPMSCILRISHKKSIIGRLWRWHINFCPGWKAYYKSLSNQEREKIKREYDFERCSQ